MQWKDHLRGLEQLRDSTRPSHLRASSGQSSSRSSGRYAQGGSVRQQMRTLASEGRGGDTRLAQIGPRTARALDDVIHRGRRQVNPRTGLREYMLPAHEEEENKYNEDNNNKNMPKKDEVELPNYENACPQYGPTCYQNVAANHAYYAMQNNYYNKERREEFQKYWQQQKKNNQLPDKNKLFDRAYMNFIREPEHQLEQPDNLAYVPAEFAQIGGGTVESVLDRDAIPYEKRTNGFFVQTPFMEEAHDALGNNQGVNFVGDVYHGTFDDKNRKRSHTFNLSRSHRYSEEEKKAFLNSNLNPQYIEDPEGSVDIEDPNIHKRILNDIPDLTAKNKKGILRGIYNSKKLYLDKPSQAIADNALAEQFRGNKPRKDPFYYDFSPITNHMTKVKFRGIKSSQQRAIDKKKQAIHQSRNKNS